MAGAQQQSQERAPTKEMTTDCNSMFSTKFIKNGFIYSCVKHTSTLLTGVNQHNEPVNHVPKIGWASCILPTKQTIAGYHLELTEAPAQDRVPHQIAKVFTREQKPDSLRGSGALVQRGSCRDTILPRNFMSQIFLVEKKDGVRYQ